ncbi:hypothetical protein L6164_024211 [Bauhinia variegata]|uniref:Uncharacterized protein n=1 Tax=Bauhinia variegata TaxID=167791 RepID=A0ACB9LWW3_BAUVA|nr:hypothetical protein L6164_024211 [Bauhinia variegata]
MEVLVGSTFTIDVPSSPPRYGRDQSSPEADDCAVPSFFLNDVDGRPKNDGSDYGLGGRQKFFAGDSSEGSSSIGTPDDSDNDISSKRDGEVGEEDEVQSKLNEEAVAGLGSLDSLEDSLPIKRGLSSHFAGKSRSFTDLSQVSTVKELKKPENPFNKRRRVQIASKLSRRSFYSWSNPKSMPLLPVNEDEDDYEEEKARKLPSPSSPSSYSSSLTEEKKQEDQVQLRQDRVAESYVAKMRLRLGSFKSRSFSLADLQEHDDEDDD